MNGIPYRLLGETARERLRQVLSDALGEWCDELRTPKNAPPTLQLDAVERSPGFAIHSSFVVLADGHPVMQILIPSATVPKLLSIPGRYAERVGATNLTSLAGALQHDLMVALAAKIISRSTFEDWKLQRSDVMKTTDTACFSASFSDGREALGLLLSPWMLDALSPVPESDAPQPASCVQGIGNNSVGVSAWAGTTEISLSELASLAVGDVLVLDSRLDEDCELRIENRAVATASLGRKEVARAVRITSVHTPTN